MRAAAFDGEVPELEADFFDGARLRAGTKVRREPDGTLTKRGRPPQGERAKVQQSLRLSPQVIEHFKAEGPGWQARIDEVLRTHVEAAGRRSSAVTETRDSYRTERGGWERPNIKRLRAGDAERNFGLLGLAAS